MMSLLGVFVPYETAANRLVDGLLSAPFPSIIKHHVDLTTAIRFSIPIMTVTATKGIIATERAALNQENTLIRY